MNMSIIKELIEKVEDDTIKNEELIILLNEENYRAISDAILTVIERKYCVEQIINRLVELSGRLTNNKLIGPWQIGHVAIATLYLVEDDKARKKYYEILGELDELNQFLVDNFIKSKTYIK